MHLYVERTSSLRKGDQCFVSWEKPITKQILFHWIVDAIALEAHSTICLKTSWALFKGVSFQDICAAARWSSPVTFARCYKLGGWRSSR